jgi:8-oxo-dGTP pyrophosphatase MutT (NUDIX family)
MSQEVSAGGVVIRELDGELAMAAIRPRGKPVWALPKGHIDPGETALEAATREVREETGLEVSLEGPLGDVRYVYRFAGQRVFKVVSFFLFRYRSGDIDALAPAMRVEVDRAAWLPLLEAPRSLAYPGEKEMARRALRRLRPPGDAAK